MKGLVPLADPASTKQGMQVVRTASPSELLASNGIGVVVPRHDPYSQRELYFPDVTISERVQAEVHPQSARQLDPIVNSEFADVGKPALHLGSPRQLWLSTDASHKLAIDGWPPEDGYFAKYIRSNVIKVTRGFQTALMDSVNIDRPGQAPYGSLAGAVGGSSRVSLDDLYIR